MRPRRPHPPRSGVDFRYSLPWWQTSICLPDDPEKPLVGKEGQFLFDYGGKGPRNFAFSLAPQVEGDMRWLRQETATAKAPIVDTRWDAGGVELRTEAFLTIPEAAEKPQPKTLRRYAVVLHLKNAGQQPQTRRPLVRIEGVVPPVFAKEQGVVTLGETTRLLASAPIEACEKQEKCWIVRLPAVEIPAGQTRTVALTILRHGQPPYAALTADAATAERDRAFRWWETANLPWDTIQVPDAGIQGMLQSCVRNIWQAREIKNGQPAFHVGPTCYRGLWVVDGAFLLESAALVGRADGSPRRHPLHPQLPAAGRAHPGHARRPVLQGERHRAVELLPARRTDARQGVARIGLAEARTDRRRHRAAPRADADQAAGPGRRPDAPGLSRRRHRRRSIPNTRTSIGISSA